ncbi:ABC transporter ATP-binding protein [Halopiger aswanensis]|uniref:ABC-type multidrug transport system ATPase subunit n=1 Tax=Halopiger aswanensis TaxID=148449 RepID=A0A3R7HG95_9EURY|nr:ABC transporter ATP-binding protein [Halopiger aswanensis]RKD88978.1 ABC-type multidrug transport system ATPase subunit [Halopiger aswanensis]
MTTATDRSQTAQGSSDPRADEIGSQPSDPPIDDVSSSNDPSAEADETLLEASNLEFAYGDVTILRDVSIAVDAGTVTALIGPNGTGKTTLLRSLAGLQEQTSGSIEYHGPDVPRKIGYLPQQPTFRPGFTVIETLEFYASLVGESREDAVSRLDQVGLADAASRRVEDLSGGMTRLLGIAQATIGDPPIVVLDEPGSGLDPGMSTHVFDVAGAFADAGTAVLVTSHDLGLIERNADEVLLLDDGVVAERGHPTELLERLDVDTLRAAYEASVAGDLHRVRVQGESQ